MEKFEVGDRVRSTVSNIIVQVLVSRSQIQGSFSGTVVASGGTYPIGYFSHLWDVKAFSILKLRISSKNGEEYVYYG